MGRYLWKIILKVSQYMVRNKKRKILLACLSCLMVITLASCRTRSYLELLTGGKVRYWLSPTKTFLMSFNKETRRCLYYTTEDFKIFYLNGLDVMSNGEYFKIIHDKVYRSWIIHGDTIPTDSFQIKSISNNELVIIFTEKAGPRTFGGC